VDYPVHYFVFNSVEGLDQPVFNTLRLGWTWAKKLKSGDRVLLATRDMVVGEAFVVSIHPGPKDEIVQAHAINNHLEQALALQPDYDPSLAFSRATALGERAYGVNAYRRARTASAIYLRRPR
jgi:hypothetical protein